MSKLEYLVNKDKRVVTCIIKEPVEESYVTLCNGIYRYFTGLGIDFGSAFNADTNKYKMPEKFVGVAKCAPEDEFDEAVGKQLAFSRAKNKYCKNKIRMYEEFIEKFGNSANEFVDFVEDRLSQLYATYQDNELFITEMKGLEPGVLTNEEIEELLDDDTDDDDTNAASCVLAVNAEEDDL